MPGTNYGPPKPTPAKRGTPTRMTNSPDTGIPPATVASTVKANPFAKTIKKIKKIGPRSRTDGVKNRKDEPPLLPVKPTGLSGLGSM